MSKANNETIDDEMQPAAPVTIFGDVGYIQRVGAILGITLNELSENAINEVNSNVTCVLRRVIAGGLRFAQHSRRVRILPEDIDAYVASEKKTPLFGFKPRGMVALKLAGSGGQQVYVEENKEIKLNTIILAPVMKIPPEPTLKPHWLAIDGEQPAVPENPIPIRREDSTNNLENVQKVIFQGDGNRLLNIIRGGRTTEQINIKATITHKLTLEQQVYYKEITEAVMGGDDKKRAEALHSLKTDTGIQTLVGRFSVVVAEGVRCNIVQHNLAFLIYLMRLVQSLVHNSSINLDKWLHEFLPAILSCILSKQVCSHPEKDNHWALREFSGRLLADLCKKHGPIIQSRVITVLTKGFKDINASMFTIYGALFTLDQFGFETIRTIIIPMIPSIYDRVHKAMTDRSTDSAEKSAATRVNIFTRTILSLYVKTVRSPNLKNLQDYINIFGGYADELYKSVSKEVDSVRPPTKPTISIPRTIQTRVIQRAPTFVTKVSRIQPNGNQQTQTVRYTTLANRRPDVNTPQPPSRK